jgi:hypothetical protein
MPRRDGKTLPQLDFLAADRSRKIVSDLAGIRRVNRVAPVKFTSFPLCQRGISLNGSAALSRSLSAGPLFFAQALGHDDNFHTGGLRDNCLDFYALKNSK